MITALHTNNSGISVSTYKNIYLNRKYTCIFDIILIQLQMDFPVDKMQIFGVRFDVIIQMLRGH